MRSYTLALKALARPPLTIARSHHHCSVRLKMVKKALNVQRQSRKRKLWLKNLYWRFVIHIHSFDYQERISWWSNISVHIMRGLSTMCLSVIAMLCLCQGIIIISRSLDGLLGRCRRNMRGTEFNVTIFVLVVLLLLLVTSLVVLLTIADLPCLFFLLRHGSTWLLAIRLLLAGAVIVLFLLRFFIIRLLTFPLWVLFLGFSLSIFVLIRRHKISYQSRKKCRNFLYFWQSFKTPRYLVEVVLIYEKTKINTFGFVGSAAQALEYIDLLAATCFEENVEIFLPAHKSHIKQECCTKRQWCSAKGESPKCKFWDEEKESHRKGLILDQLAPLAFDISVLNKNYLDDWYI